jgi:hypothetical protein
MLNLDYLPFGTHRLLEVDNRLIIPINTIVKFLITSVDVIHSFALPELGVKIDAIPGRLNAVTTLINRPGVYFGQCSELCGENHAFMPIVLNTVNKEFWNLYLFFGFDINFLFNLSIINNEIDFINLFYLIKYHKILPINKIFENLLILKIYFISS